MQDKIAITFKNQILKDILNENSDYVNTFFTRYGLLIMLLCHLRNMNFSRFKINFATNFIRKHPFLRQIFYRSSYKNLLQNFTMRNFLTV